MMKTFAQFVIAFILLSVISPAQTTQGILSRPEFWFQILDSDGAVYHVVASAITNEPIFNNFNSLTNSYNVGEFYVSAIPNTLMEDYGFDHIHSSDSGTDHPILAYGKYEIYIYRNSILKRHFRFNLRHYRYSIQDIYFRITKNVNDTFTVSYGLSSGQVIEYIDENEILNYWNILSESQNLQVFFNSPEIISNNLTIAHENYNNILGSITVNSGVTLTVDYGSQLQFGSNTGLIVNGTISASSSTFSKINTAANWNGIQFNSGSSGTLQYCTIQNATNGITFNNTGSASITIANCTIQNNVYAGIYMNNSSPIISFNTISSNGSRGIYCYSYSCPKINNNTIQSNSLAGIYCSYYSSPAANLYYYGPGNNVIQSNYGYGMFAEYNCIPSFGSSGGGGLNNFNQNTDHEIAAYYGCTVWAQYNYWGPNSTIDPHQSTIYTDYPQGNMIVSSSNPIKVSTSGADLNIHLSDNMQINYLMTDDDPSEREIKKYKDMYQQETNTANKRFALIMLEKIYWYSKKVGFEDFVDNEILSRKNAKDEFTVMAYELLNHSYMEKGNYKQVVSNLERIRTELNLDSEIEKNTLFTLGLVYMTNLKDNFASSNYFDELRRKYPDDQLTRDSYTLMGIQTNSNIKPKSNLPAEEKSLNKELPEELSLLNCYPNPFNPTTKISYQLPEKSSVVLKIYDALGKEVRTLVNSSKEAGYHSVDFDASNLPSGLYIYQIRAGKFNQSKKMLLVK